MSNDHGSDHDRRDPGPLPPALAAYTEYKVVRKLGRGGMGVVYLARNRLTGRFEALKLCTGSGHGDEPPRADAARQPWSGGRSGRAYPADPVDTHAGVDWAKLRRRLPDFPERLALPVYPDAQWER